VAYLASTEKGRGRERRLAPTKSLTGEDSIPSIWTEDEGQGKENWGGGGRGGPTVAKKGYIALIGRGE